MSVVIREHDVTIIEVGPSYDSFDDRSLDRLAEILLKQAAEADPPRLVLDLSETKFIGSRFIGLLVRSWKRVRDRQGRMVLCSLQPFCREALENTRLLNTLWTTHPTRAEALQALSSSESESP